MVGKQTLRNLGNYVACSANAPNHSYFLRGPSVQKVSVPTLVLIGGVILLFLLGIYLGLRIK